MKRNMEEKILKEFLKELNRSKNVEAVVMRLINSQTFTAKMKMRLLGMALLKAKGVA